VTRNGREYVVLIAAEDLESIEATLELLADPAAQQRIAESQQEIARGEGPDPGAGRQSLEGAFREALKLTYQVTIAPTAAPQLTRQDPTTGSRSLGVL